MYVRVDWSMVERPLSTTLPLTPPPFTYSPSPQCTALGSLLVWNAPYALLFFLRAQGHRTAFDRSVRTRVAKTQTNIQGWLACYLAVLAGLLSPHPPTHRPNKPTRTPTEPTYTHTHYHIHITGT